MEHHVCVAEDLKAKAIFDVDDKFTHNTHYMIDLLSKVF